MELLVTTTNAVWWISARYESTEYRVKTCGFCTVIAVISA